MKILILSHKFSPFAGGIEVMSEELASYLFYSGHEIHVLTWTKEVEDDKQFPYKIIRNQGLFSILREHYWADIIFENNPNLRLSWPAFFHHKPHLIVLHGQICRNDRSIGFQDKLKFQWLKLADKVLAVSDSLKEQTFIKAEVIHNFYRDNQFKVLNNTRKINSFVFLGRLVSVKGVDLAIRTIAKLIKLKPEFSDIELTIIGDGSMLQDLKKLVTDLELKENVFFLGILKDNLLVKELNKHSYMLVPSSQEPFGLVALEGMACGCLPIVSNIDGLPEAVGNAGFIVNEYSVDGFFDAIICLKENPAFENELRAKSKAHLEMHTKEFVCSKYKNVIEALI